MIKTLWRWKVYLCPFWLCCLCEYLLILFSLDFVPEFWIFILDILQREFRDILKIMSAKCPKIILSYLISLYLMDIFTPAFIKWIKYEQYWISERLFLEVKFRNNDIYLKWHETSFSGMNVCALSIIKRHHHGCHCGVAHKSATCNASIPSWTPVCVMTAPFLSQFPANGQEKVAEDGLNMKASCHTHGK